MMIHRLIILTIAALFVAPALPRAAWPEAASFERGSFAEILRAHRGKPVIVHFWGMSCGPCLVELADWGRFLGDHPDAGLVMVHSERLPPLQRILTETLSDAGLAKAENWAFGETAADRLRFEVDPSWHGEIPMTLLISADGKPERLIGRADFARISEWLGAKKSAGAQQDKQQPAQQSNNSDDGAFSNVF